MTGKTLSHYEIQDQLGAGGMGEVYRARDLSWAAVSRQGPACRLRVGSRSHLAFRA